MKIRWRVVVKDGQAMPAGPYLLAYQDNDTLIGIFWLIPIAIMIRIYRFMNYWYNVFKGKRTFFDRHLIEQYNDGFRAGYEQHIRDSHGTERKLKAFQERIKANGKNLKIN